MIKSKPYQSSFRDNKNFVFRDGDKIKRQINPLGFEDFRRLVDSGLYDELISKKLLVSHTVEYSGSDKIIICPQQVPFISYPYEWSFSMLKDAALLTIELMKTAVQYGMILKDASAYNVQFMNGQSVFIDTGSFEQYVPSQPWRAYRQFCEHFLAPLLLMSGCDLSLQNLLVSNLDGIPLALAAKLLPLKVKMRPSVYMHIVLHSKLQICYEASSAPTSSRTFSKFKLRALLESLEGLIKSLKFPTSQTQWQDYYDDNNYTPQAFNAKKEMVLGMINSTRPQTVWDVGANQGVFSRLGDKNIAYLDLDIDPAAIEKNYLEIKESRRTNILPLKFDFNNPSPALGVGNDERLSLFERQMPDVVLFLALIHHLVIVYKVPFKKIAEVLARLSPAVVLEFVLPEDTQVQKLIKTRDNADFEYSQEIFEKTFSEYFELAEKTQIPDSKRLLYLMKRKPHK